MITKKKGVYIDGAIWSRPSKEKDAMALRATCGYITGFPSNSASTVALVSSLLNTGSATSKGRTIEYRHSEVA